MLRYQGESFIEASCKESCGNCIKKIPTCHKDMKECAELILEVIKTSLSDNLMGINKAEITSMMFGKEKDVIKKLQRIMTVKLEKELWEIKLTLGELDRRQQLTH